MATVNAQRIIRGSLGRAVARRKRHASYVVTLYGKTLVRYLISRRWRRWMGLRQRYSAIAIQRAYRAHRKRLFNAAVATRTARMMAQSLLLWVMNVNLKYLWGRRVLARRALEKAQAKAARLIQRVWISHVVRSSMAQGWDYIKKRAMARKRERGLASTQIQRFVRR